MRGVDVRFGPDDPETDPRLTEVYDAENPWGVDDDFVLELGSQRPRTRVVDLGCGTGRLAIALANTGALVTVVDPNPAMLRWARSKPGADSVTWIEGTAVDLGSHQFDMALMTSHVAQVYVEDSEWCDVLAHLRGALVPGGVLCFDSRDPRARAWDQWTSDRTRAAVTLSGARVVRTWVDVVSVEDDIVRFVWANVFPGGDVVEGTSPLRFRTEDSVRTTVESAGFEILELFGNWRGDPVGAQTAELIVIGVAT
jgi:SAM-dependent methyltransferase